MRGFTLIEILVAAVLAILVGSLLFGLMVKNTGVFYKESSKVGQGLNINDALSSIRSNAKLSETVATSHQISGVTYTSNATSLVLQLASIDISGLIIPNTFDWVVYLKSGDKLYYKLAPGAGSKRKAINQILANNVDTLTFQYYQTDGIEIAPASASKVKVSIKLKQQAGSGIETSVATSEATLRND